MPISKPTLVTVKTITAPDPALGSLSVISAGGDLGFPLKRVYYIHSMNGGAERGGHAHKSLYQSLTAVAGSVRITLEGKDGAAEFLLDSPEKALLVPPGYWRNMDGFAPGTVLIVLASADYDEADYIRDYAEFQTWLAQRSV